MSVSVRVQTPTPIVDFDDETVHGTLPREGIAMTSFVWDELVNMLNTL